MTIMELNEYQNLAKMTRNDSQGIEMERANYGLGLGEAGELQNIVKKNVFHGHDLERTKAEVLDESGDVMWYLAMPNETYGITLEEVAQHNIAKLRRRYPEGFSKEASQNRVV